MKTKTIKWIILVFWPFFFCFCVSYHPETGSTQNVRINKFYGTQILAVQMRGGDYYRFRDGASARMVIDHVVGQAIVPREFPLDQIKGQQRDDEGNIIQLTDANGKIYSPITARPVKDKYLAYFADSPSVSVSLPYADIETLTVMKRRGDVVTAIICIAVVAAFVFGVIGASATAPRAPSGKSCPFIYSYDSENFMLDAEPYGGAICRGLKRTEWLPLSHLREADGGYRVLVANELDEMEFTDELKLVVVDHPRGVSVVPDAQGRVHSLLKPEPPQKAVDKDNRDILPFITAADGYFWTGRPEAMDPDKPASLRDSLTLEFPKPAGARTAKLLAGAWTTVQGSASAEGILGLHGREINRYYEEVNARGPAYRNLMAWYMNEELYMLKVWVETKDGWQPRGLIYGGGPFVAKEKAYVLDVSDVPGEVLRIRLNPPLEFWMFDRLAVDYSPDLPLNSREIAATSALDQDGRDVRRLLASNDDIFLKMPNKGDQTELRFDAPPRIPGLDRTVLLKASGYYDVRLEAKGEPRRELLDRIHNEPGFTLRFAYEWRRQAFGGQARVH